MLTDKFTGCVAEHPVFCRIGVDDDPVLIGEADTLGHALHENSVLTERIFRSPVLRAVLHDLDEAHDRARIVLERGEFSAGPEALAALALMPAFVNGTTVGQ